MNGLGFLYMHVVFSLSLQQNQFLTNVCSVANIFVRNKTEHSEREDLAFLEFQTTTSDGWW